MSIEELFSVVDKKDNHLYTVNGKNALHGCPGYHRSVHIFVEVFGGGFVIQKKAESLENGGKWSPAAFGHVRCSENYKQAAIRKLEEEIGLKIIEEKELHRITKLNPCISKDTDREFVTLFTYLMDPSTESIKISSNEVDLIMIAPLEMISEEIDENPENYSPIFMKLFDIFIKTKK